VAGPQLPGPVAAVVANFAVNMGHSPAVKLLQEAIGVKVDLGPRTVSSAQALPKIVCASSRGYFARRCALRALGRQ
jgi:lysozyme family protein